MGQGPLCDPRLLEIESKLNAGRFDEAQRLLATIFDIPGAQLASAYFATRLLFQRGRLDRAGVVLRLRELLSRGTPFPEAERMLQAAEAGVLEPSPEVFCRVTGAPDATAERAAPRNIQGFRVPSRQEIPRAPLVPRFTPRSGVPSYLPQTPHPPKPEAEAVPALGTDSEPQQEPPTLHQDRELTSTLGAPPTFPKPPVVAPSINTASTLPPPAEDAPEVPRPQPSPSLFEIAAALEAGDAAKALELAERAGAESVPELTLLAARALLALGERARAWNQLQRLLKAPLLEPSVRAASARLLVELGRPEEALAQARRALEEDPSDPLARMACAWALVRLLRRSGDAECAVEAQQLLSRVRARDGNIVALFGALRAALTAETGDPARALTLAQTALQQEPRQVDALASVVIATARLGHRSDMQRAYERLRELDAEEADATAKAVSRHGVELNLPETKPRRTLEALTSFWGKEEGSLLQGRRDLAIAALSKAATRAVQALPKRSKPEAWSRLAGTAAQTLTELPVFRHFAPYDRSLFSVERLDAALRVLFGKASKEARPANDALETLLSAYVGESWRQAFGAEWQSGPATAGAVRIEGIGISAYPCERLQQRLREGTPLTMEPPEHLHPGADPLGNSVPLSLCPPCPWDPQPWPTQEQLSELGRLLPDSVIGLYCAEQLNQPLDHSVVGVLALDRYVALLAPHKAPPDPDAAWGRRVAILLGAYFGAVLTDAVGAHWDIDARPANAASYRLVLPYGAVETPIARVLDRLSGRKVSPLSDYVGRLAGGRISVNA